MLGNTPLKVPVMPTLNIIYYCIGKELLRSVCECFYLERERERSTRRYIYRKTGSCSKERGLAASKERVLFFVSSRRTVYLMRVGHRNTGISVRCEQRHISGKHAPLDTIPVIINGHRYCHGCQCDVDIKLMLTCAVQSQHLR